MTTSTDPTNTPDDTPDDLVPTSSPTSSQQGPGHQRDDLVPQSPSPTEGDEVSEPPRPRPGTTSRARPAPHATDPASSTPWATAIADWRRLLDDERCLCSSAHTDWRALDDLLVAFADALARAEAAESARSRVEALAERASRKGYDLDPDDLLEALATPTTPDGYRCPDCGWKQKPHPTYGWQRHDERAVEVHKTQLCPARGTETPADTEPDTTVTLTQQEFDDLLEYSTSLPTGTTIGKRWKRHVFAGPHAGEWQMGEYVEDPDPDMVGIKWRTITIAGADQ